MKICKIIKIAAFVAATIFLASSCRKELDNQKDKLIDVSSIKINGQSPRYLIKGSSEQLVVTIIPKNASDKAIKWTSTNNNVASVDEHGLVTANNIGIATIQATSKYSDNVSASCQVEVVLEPVTLTGLALSPGELLLAVGSSDYFTPVFTPSGTTERVLKWNSSDESVATIDERGQITAVKKGSVTITATSMGTHSLSATATARIVEPFTSIEIQFPDKTHERYVTSNGGYFELHVGENGLPITAVGYPLDCGDKLAFRSSDPSVLSVSEDGFVKPLKYSANLVTVYVGSQAGTVEKTLRFKVWDEPTGVKLSIKNTAFTLATSGRPSEYIGVGHTQEFAVSVEPSTAKQAPLLQTWSLNLNCTMTGTNLKVQPKETAVPGTASSPTEAYVRLYAAGKEFKVDFKISKYDPYQPKPGDGLYQYSSSLGTYFRAVDSGWRGNDVFETSLSATSDFSKVFAIIGHIGKEWLREDPNALTNTGMIRWHDLDRAEDDYARGIAIPVNVSYIYMNGSLDHSQGMPFCDAPADLSAFDSKLGYPGISDFKHTAYANAALLKRWNQDHSSSKNSGYRITPFFYFNTDDNSWYFGSSSAVGLNDQAYLNPDGSASSPWIMPTVADLFSIFVGRVPGYGEYQQDLDYSYRLLMIVSGSDLKEESKNRISVFKKSAKLFRKKNLDYSHWLWCAQQYDTNHGLQFIPLDNGQAQFRFHPKTTAAEGYVLPILYF